MTLNFYKKMSGYVKIQLEGYFVERFLNLALNQKITIWDIRRMQDGRIIAKVTPKEFKYLRKIARTTKCRVKILKKSGIPFLIIKYRKRKIFVIFILVAIISVCVYNSYIWQVDIIGDFSIPIEEIKSQLAEENLKVAVRKSAVDIEQLKLNMALKRNDLAWVGVNIKGTKATVEIVEKVMLEHEELDGIPCNIVASKDGIVTKIFVKDGTACVQKDDLVQKGQILISGVMTSEFADERLVHADGDVYAKTWYVYKSKAPYKKDVISKTGNTEKRYKIKLLNNEINLLNNSTNFEKYDTIKKTNQLKIFNCFILPLEITETTYQEISVETITLSKEQAIRMAQNDAMNMAMQLVPAGVEIIDNSTLTREYDDGIEAEVSIECIERIGTKEKLGG